jgi:hypothetical protein
VATIRMEEGPSAEVSTPREPTAVSTHPAHAIEFPGLGSVNSVRAEIEDVLFDMRQFHKSEPDMVMTVVSGQSARLAEIIVQCRRLEVQYRQWKVVREESEFVLGQLREQFQIASRLVTVRSLDQSLIGGQL